MKNRFMFILPIFAMALSLIALQTHAQVDARFSVGGVRLGPSTTTCDGTVEGGLRYNADDGVIELCDGDEWASLGGGGGNCTNWDNVSLFMNFDSNEADYSSDEHAVTKWETAAVSSSQKKFGARSLYVDGNGDYLELSNSGGDFTFGSDNFTIETWAYPTNSSATGPIFITSPTTNGHGIWFGIHANEWYGNVGDGSWISGGFSGGSVSANTWSHFAMVRNGNNLKLYVNGTQVVSTTSSKVLTANSTVTIGGRTLNGQWFPGYIDDLRITRGVALYTSNFTPPAEGFTNCGGGTGGTVETGIIYVSTSLVPTLSGNTSAPPIAISASSAHFNQNLQPWKAFNKSWSGWNVGQCFEGTSGWMRVDFGSSKTITSYKIRGREDNQGYTWKTWTFQGSDNASTWTTLDTRSSETGWSSNQVRTYTLSSPGTYRYFRWNVTANNGLTLSCIQEAELWGY